MVTSNIIIFTINIIREPYLTISYIKSFSLSMPHIFNLKQANEEEEQYERDFIAKIDKVLYLSS